MDGNPLELVCGSTGFIGSNLYKALANQDQGRAGKNVRKSEGDLRVFENCQRSVKGVDTVYMMAGVTGGVGLLKSDPYAMVTPNVIINANMFKACAEEGVKKIICMSSTTGYPFSNYALKEDQYFTGEVIPGYFNTGHTRRYIERLGSMYQDMSVIFLRCAGAYGPGDDFHPETSHVVGATVKKVAERQNPIHIWGDGKDVRDLTYIDDLVRALILAGDLEGHHSINIGSGRGVDINTIVSILCDLAGYAPLTLHDGRDSIMRFRVLNIDIAKEVLGWEPKVSIEEGLSKTLGWYESN